MILELLSSSAVGTALGGVFSFLTKVEERKALAVKNAHEAAMAQVQAQAQAAANAHALAMADKAMDAAKVAGAIEEAKGELTAFIESQKAGGHQAGPSWADKLQTAMRPVITGLLFAMTCWLAMRLYDLVTPTAEGAVGLSIQDASALWKHMVYELVFLTSTAISWWFGSRPSSVRAPRK